MQKRQSFQFIELIWQPFQVQSADLIEIATGKAGCNARGGGNDLRCTSAVSEARELTYIHTQ